VAATADHVPRTVPVLLQFRTTVIVTWPVAGRPFRLSVRGSAGEVDPVDFDALRAAVVPGAGVVGRWPGVICVAECADRAVLRRLLDVCASAVGTEPGRALARKLAMWLGSPDAPGEGLRFGTVAVTGGEGRAGAPRGEQWAVFLYGPVGLVVPDRQVALSGAQSVAWTDRLMPRPDVPVVLALEGEPIPPGMVDGVHDLRAGVVPGAGAVLVPGGDGITGETVEESARNRPDDSAWLDSGGGQDRHRWPTEPAPAVPAGGLYLGDGPGNGVPPRGGLGAVDGFGGYDGADAGRDRPSGRAHLRPVPSGSNGVAHRDWLPRRGSALDVGRVPDAEQDHGAGPAEADRTDSGPPSRADERGSPPGRDDQHGPGIGDEHAPDNGHPLNSSGLNSGGLNGSGRNGSGRNGARTNGASYDLLGGSPDTSNGEPERSPWSDGLGRDAGRPDRIEGWFSPRGDAGTEVGLGAVGPTEGRRPRHGRRDEDTPSESDGSDGGRGGAAVADELGAAAGDYGAPAGEEPGIGNGEFGTEFASEFGSGSGDARSSDALAARAGSDAGIDAGPPPAPAEDLGGSGEGTPRLGVPRAVPPPDAPAEPEPGSEREAPPHTTVLRSERILGIPPGELERGALEDGIVTSGLAVDSRQDEQQVHGYPCVHGHLNDPRVQVCALCGVRMEEQAGPPVPGPRPPLGLVVFEDGATYTVDAEYVMGRMPEADPRVASGALRPLALEDTSGAVSRVHAQIVLDGWDALIVDAGSRNGTFVCPPGEQGWTQLPAGESYRLVPGTRVRIGGRSFLFESPSGAR
jgi:hypothetical protein